MIIDWTDFIVVSNFRGLIVHTSFWLAWILNNLKCSQHDLMNLMNEFRFKTRQTAWLISLGVDDIRNVYGPGWAPFALGEKTFPQGPWLRITLRFIFARPFFLNRCTELNFCNIGNLSSQGCFFLKSWYDLPPVEGLSAKYFFLHFWTKILLGRNSSRNLTRFFD